MYISQSNSTFLATRTISKPFENGSKLFGFREEKKWEAPNILGSFLFSALLEMAVTLQRPTFSILMAMNPNPPMPPTARRSVGLK